MECIFGYPKTKYMTLGPKFWFFPQHSCFGSPFLPPLSVSSLIAGIELFRPPRATRTPLLWLLWCCTAPPLDLSTYQNWKVDKSSGFITFFWHLRFHDFQKVYKNQCILTMFALPNRKSSNTSGFIRFFEIWIFFIFRKVYKHQRNLKHFWKHEFRKNTIIL